MSPFPWSDLAVLAALILLNGVFAMSELAIVSARTARLRVAAERGSGGARVALQLAANPGKFLSTVQIGITLVGIVAGYVSGATLGQPLGERLALIGIPAEYADSAGAVLAIGLTTYLSVVVGELVPKQFALRAAVPIALLMSRPMALLAKIAAPFVWLLDTSSGLLMRLLGIGQRGEHRLTAEELQMLFSEATHSGVIEEQERAIADDAEIRARIAASPHSRLPVADGSADRVLGVVKIGDVLARLLAGEPVQLRELMRKAPVVPDQLDAMDALRLLQKSGTGMAMVHDEYGHLDGIVTPADLLSAIVGSFVSHLDEGEEPLVVERDDGSLLIGGALGADEFAERLGLELPEDREFATAAGYVLWMLKRLPQEGERFEDQGWRFEVVDMDGRRIDKLLVSSVG